MASCCVRIDTIFVFSAAFLCTAWGVSSPKVFGAATRAGADAALARWPRSARLRHQRRYAQRLGIAEPWVEPPRRGAQARFGNVR